MADAIKVERLGLTLSYWNLPEPESWELRYVPVFRNAGGGEQTQGLYGGQVRWGIAELPSILVEKLSRLVDALLATAVPPISPAGSNDALPVPQAEMSSLSLLIGYAGMPGLGSVSLAFTIPALNHMSSDTFLPHDLTPGTLRLIANIVPSLEQLGWNDLRIKLGAQPVTAGIKRKVLISYRRGDEQRTAFVEAIAHRLGRDGFLPWFDEWEIRAGDSLPREIGDGFKDVYAVIPVLSANYPGGTWAREELETAITLRVQKNIRVIPAVYEDCDIPELLRPLVYVDCKTHDPDVFETQFSKIIDALNELELNPYR